MSVDYENSAAEIFATFPMNMTGWSLQNAEIEFRYEVAVRWVAEYYLAGFALAAAYVAMVFIGPILMRNRAPFLLETALVVWNTLLALFSITALIRLTPDFVEVTRRGGFHGTLCDMNNFYSGVSGFWHFTFILSKFVEMGDTVFLVLRKKPIIFLHWYHHAIVAALCLVTYFYPCSATRWGDYMNLIVHSFMYTYFALRAMKIWMPKWTAMAVTTLQVLQFVHAVFLITLNQYKLHLQSPKDLNCTQLSETSMNIYSVLYYPFFFLFLHYFIKRYLTKTNVSACDKTTQQNNVLNRKLG